MSPDLQTSAQLFRKNSLTLATLALLNKNETKNACSKNREPHKSEIRDLPGAQPLVEMAGIEPASEKGLPRLSTSVAFVLKFPRLHAQKQA